MRTNNRRPIDALFPTIRQEILASTLLHPQRWWYLRDLAGHLNRRPSSLQRELASLVQAGVLRRKREGRQVYYQPEPDCPFLSELQGILLKTVGLVDVLSDALRPRADKIECAFVYGSMAEAREVSQSDVDLMVVGDIGLSDIAPLLRKAERRLARPVNPAVYTPAEFSEKLRSKHHFLLSVVQGAQLFVLGNKDVLAKYGS